LCDFDPRRLTFSNTGCPENAGQSFIKMVKFVRDQTHDEDIIGWIFPGGGHAVTYGDPASPFNALTRGFKII
jgi:hypothetical protein